MKIITHRGLNSDRPGFFAESSFEAFSAFLRDGFGLEFDPQFTDDGKIFVSHEKQNGTLNTLLKKRVGGQRFTSLQELVSLIDTKGAEDSLSAIHLKSRLQKNRDQIKMILDIVSLLPTKKYLIFDCTIPAAEYIKKLNPNVWLAPSVAHPYDIKRYNSATGETLYSLDEILRHKNLFEWVWLDEWDKTDENGGEKSLYNKDSFSLLKKAGFKIAVISPELHSTSPGLLGGESHQDAKDKNKLFERIREIISLEPDAICTDYPLSVEKMIKDE